MKLVIGIGNPGEKYKGNRHNVGFVVLDRLAQELGIRNYELRKKFESLVTSHKSLVLAKPQTMMNSSGKAVKKLVDHYKIKTPDLWVIHDDLDLRLGNYKTQKGKGPREHKGLLSIYEALRTKDFWHVRVGVDNRDPGDRIDGEKYVLQDFTDKELAVIEQVIAKITLDLNSQLTK